MTDRPRGAPGASVRVVLAGLAVFVLVSVDVLADGPLVRLDHRISRWTGSSGVAGQGWIDWLTQFGNFVVVGAVLAVAVGRLAWRARTVRPLVRLVVLGVATAAAVTALKIGFHREDPTTWRGYGEGYRSYPSGHTATSIVLWGLLAEVAARHAVSEAARRLTRLLAWLAPAITMTAMVLRDYHWLTDVVAAAGLGLVLLHGERLVLRHWPGARRGSAARPGGTAPRDEPVHPGGG